MGGTKVLNNNGVQIRIFDTKDVASFGRTWTGFKWKTEKKWQIIIFLS